MDYDLAYQQLTDRLSLFKDRVEDPAIQEKIDSISSVLKTPIVIRPATQELKSFEQDVQTVLEKKQQEVRQLAKEVSSDDTFLAKLQRDDVALVSDDHIQLSFSSPLFTTTKETYSFIQQQESPCKAYMDTNASLVN